MNWLSCFGGGIDNKRGNGNLLSQLPDDLIREILIRLPADQLWKCRRVCKRWHHVIISPEFAQQHAQRAPSLVFLQNTRKYMHSHVKKARKRFFYFDRAMKKVRFANHWNYNPMWSTYPIVRDSCNGLLLLVPCFEHYWGFDRELFFIGNPTTGELQRFQKPTKSGYFCGFFFHSMEFKLLHVDGNWLSNPTPPIYSIFSLRTQMWRNIHNVPHGFYPAIYKPPVNINKYNYLFWMVFGSDNYNFDCRHSIIVFNMDTEKFDGFPHPDHPSYSACVGNMHANMHLLEMEGRVTWWLQLSSQFHVWSLDIDEYGGSGGWTWTPLYTLPYRSDFQRYPFFGSIDGRINLVTIRDKQVLLVWSYRGVFWYNLETNAIAQVKLTEKKMNKLRFFEWELVMIDYTKTVVTLKQNMIRAVV
ncbi:hypothetical protein CCACVL1_22815 [Corchorus capsularis]|uniref:F-box domain-containing protein n=1 Tax=Corchorus capsularis TaxID=210143 RepID=A0A1R3GWS5_COCAP|nr:hypothetical protein CCACVL1_22815 [Corchorus capsularis]